ncbi:MAG: septal ring lytic transglycosylase RlpA family protein [Deltaproteobacteria bacterium]|jgi:rare lipoprotein A (peptidoglycan hydrolase)|nr:septal ring lytic transglycosylase RlpA family protein [Deltaproteobacteria bacterium]
MSNQARNYINHADNAPKGWAASAFLWVGAALIVTLIGSGCGILSSGPKKSGKSYVVNGKRYYLLKTAEGYQEKGLASWYGEPFHGRKTASGEVYNMHELSAAHKTLPLKTWVEVKNLQTNQTMYLRINDRGPFIKGRIIDLSKAAAEHLGTLRQGVVPVEVRAVSSETAKKLEARRKKLAKKHLISLESAGL